MSTQAELFTKDLEHFHTEQKHYLDASGNFIGYDMTKGIRAIPLPSDKKITFDNKIFFKGYGTVTDPTCTMDDPTLQGGTYIGLSNMNFGHITKPEEFGGTMIQDLSGWDNQRISEATKAYLYNMDVLPKTLNHEEFLVKGELTAPLVETLNHEEFLVKGELTAPLVETLNHEEFLVKGELTAPLVEAQDEDCSDKETEWLCKGCSKYFATKASLKRHHDRKKSCKEICEKPVKTEVNVPERPYILEWVDQLLTKAISGDSEKPYCKHCEVEFANKTNLNKHLSKSVACDKLAKQELVKFVSN